MHGISHGPQSLKTSLFNMGLASVAEAVLKDHGIRLDNIYEQEPDAGLGNGGLGRLAACYLDGMATNDIPGIGLFASCTNTAFSSRKSWTAGRTELRRQLAARRRRVADKADPDQAVEVRFDGEIEEMLGRLRTTT